MISECPRVRSLARSYSRQRTLRPTSSASRFRSRRSPRWWSATVSCWASFARTLSAKSQGSPSASLPSGVGNLSTSTRSDKPRTRVCAAARGARKTRIGRHALMLSFPVSFHPPASSIKGNPNYTYHALICGNTLDLLGVAAHVTLSRYVSASSSRYTSRGRAPSIGFVSRSRPWCSLGCAIGPTRSPARSPSRPCARCRRLACPTC